MKVLRRPVVMALCHTTAQPSQFPILLKGEVNWQHSENPALFLPGPVLRCHLLGASDHLVGRVVGVELPADMSALESPVPKGLKRAKGRGYMCGVGPVLVPILLGRLQLDTVKCQRGWNCSNGSSHGLILGPKADRGQASTVGNPSPDPFSCF